MSKKLDKILLKLSAIEQAVERLVSRDKGARSRPHQQAPAEAPRKPESGKRQAAAASSKRKTSSAAETHRASKSPKQTQRGTEKRGSAPKKRTSRVEKIPLEIVEKGSKGQADRVISLNDIPE